MHMLLAIESIEYDPRECFDVMERSETCIFTLSSYQGHKITAEPSIRPWCAEREGL